MLHTLLYFLALIGLSSSSSWAKLSQMPVDVLGFYRLSIAAVVMLFWIGFVKKITWPKLDTKIYWILVSGVFFFLHLWTYKYASKNTSIANTMIIFSSNPIWASIGAVVFFKEYLSYRLILSYMTALIGVYLLVAHNLNLDAATHYGDWSALASAVFYALYMLTGKKARSYYDNGFYSFIQYGICGLLFGVCVVFNQSSLGPYNSVSWVALAGLVLLPTFLGHLSFTYLVNHMNLSLMSCGKLLEPVFASIMAYYLFNEGVSPYAWIAFSLTSLSIVILFSPSLVRYTKKIFHVHSE